MSSSSVSKSALTEVAPAASENARRSGMTVQRM